MKRERKIATALYLGLTLIIAAVDSYLREESFYTGVNIALRVAVLLPLLFAITQGKSRYAVLLRKTLWIVMLADTLLPVYFPAGMAAFLGVHALNVRNFAQFVNIRQDTLRSVVAPGIVAFGTAIALYLLVLYPSLDDTFKILVGLYIAPIASAWSLSITSHIQTKTRWTRTACIGMSLFFLTDFQVATQFLTDINIPHYGLVNAITYYTGLFLMSQATTHIQKPQTPQ